MKEWEEWIVAAIIAVAFWAVVLLLACCLSGCHQPRADLTPATDETKRDMHKDKELIEKIFATNYLVSGFIVVSAIGVFCCFSRQLQLGLALIATGGAGIWITRADQSLAQNQWFLLIPTGLLVVGIGIWVFKNEQIRTALKQIIRGVDNMGANNKESYKEFKEWQGQSKPTEKIVQEIKRKL